MGLPPGGPVSYFSKLLDERRHPCDNAGMTSTAIVQIGYKRLQHYAGQRPTRVTYAGAMKRADDIVSYCGHELHRTPEAALRCAQAIDKLEART